MVVKSVLLLAGCFVDLCQARNVHSEAEHRLHDRDRQHSGKLRILDDRHLFDANPQWKGVSPVYPNRGSKIIALSNMMLAVCPSLPCRKSSITSNAIRDAQPNYDRRFKPPMMFGELRISTRNQLPRSYDRDVAKLVADNFVLPADGSQSVGRSALGSVQSDLMRLGLQSEFWIALDDAGVAGIIGIRVEEFKYEIKKLDGMSRPVLVNLVVDESRRSQGLGKKLCNLVDSKAREWGYDEIFLNVEADNKGAQKFYKKLGYRQVAVYRDAERPKDGGRSGLKFVPTTQLIMRKDLKFPPIDVVITPFALVAAGLFAKEFVSTGGIPW